MKKFLLLFSFLISTFHIKAQFGPQNEITKSTANPQDVKAYDLDGDGDLDLLAALNYVDKIAWYENVGAGVFSSQQIITTNAAHATSIWATDLDGDNDLDVLSASKDDDKIAWYENLGGGAFGSQQIISTIADGSSCVLTSDVDGDGDQDVLSASYYDNKIAWYENLGGGAFGSQQIISSNANGAQSIFASDLDRDGDEDILSASKDDDKIAWYENLGGGAFGSQQIINSNAIEANSVYAADIDGDGDQDVLSASTLDDKVAWYENLGGGAFGTAQLISWVDGAYSVSGADLDGDGDIDVLSASQNDNKIAWHENLGGGAFGTQQFITIYPAVSKPQCVSSADLNGDGNIDIISGSRNDSRIAWYENLGGGAFGIQQEVSTNDDQIRSINLADLDNDGDLDVISASQNTKISFYMNHGNGSFGGKQTINTNVLSPMFVYSFDLDNDSDQDILSASWSDNKIAWYENLGSGVIDTIQNIITTSAIGASWIYSADLDGDGDQDILSASYNDDKIAWYENLGGGAFGTQQNISTSADGAYSVHATDIDGDGDQDVLSASKLDDKIAWYENLGGGSFGSEQIISINADLARCVYSADLDNDGDQDVLSASKNDNKIAWYENLGGGSFGSEQIISANAGGASYVRASDYDADGDMDVFSASETDDKIAWHENLGGGSFGSQQYINSPHLFGNNLNGNADAPHSICIGDVDGDGDMDVLSGSINDDKIAWYENYFDNDYKFQGNHFYDANQNAIIDSNEWGFSFVKTQLQPNSLFSYTASNGNYYFATDSGTYTISYTPDSLWNLTTDSATYTRTLTGAIPIVDSLNFGFYPDTIVTVIEPTLTGSFPRCNQTINYWINIRNLGTALPSGKIHLQLDDAIDYISSTIAPDSIIGQNLYWHYDSLFFYSEEKFNLQIQMPPFNSIGDTLTSILTVDELDSLGSGAITYSNTDTLEQVLVCAYDPNDKTVTPKGLGSPGYILNNTKLEYLIRFQNTGNDTALTVMIRDQLDVNLDWSTLQPIASSHQMEVWIEQNGEAVFKFENIMLPDSNVSEIASHGFVKFNIDMKPNLLPGTVIQNKGHIYFDFNPAVITNTVVNTIYDCNKTPINLMNAAVCIGERLSASSLDGSFSTCQWEIDNFYTSNSNTLNWLADTAGMFNLKLNISNEFCSKDITTIITILPTIPITNVNQTICMGDSILLEGVYQVNNGIYNDTLQSFIGCDSILSTKLTINKIFSLNQNVSICQRESVLIYGIYQNTAGVYYDSLQTINGCDSLFSTTLSVDPLPSVALAAFNPDTLCDNTSAVTLPTGSPIGGNYSGNGVSSGNFSPSTAGVGAHNIFYTYTDGNSCTNGDTTIVTVEICAGIENISSDYGIIIYPNPSTGQFTIEKPSDFNKEVQVKLLDATSKLILEKVIPKGNQKVEMDIRNYSKGIYYLQLIVKDEIFTKKILKN